MVRGRKKRSNKKQNAREGQGHAFEQDLDLIILLSIFNLSYILLNIYKYDMIGLL